MVKRAVILGVGHYLPERIVTNKEFEGTIDTTDEWIKSRSGIEQRHFAAEGEMTSDLATHAALSALKNAGVVAQDIDAIVVATSTPDLTFPSVATMVQHRISNTTGYAFDIQAVCAGFVYALSTANALLVSGQAKRALVIGAETVSRIIDWTDRSTCVLFGDGAGALVLEAQDTDDTPQSRGILATDLHSDGQYKDLLYVNGGVSCQKIGVLQMQGKEVFRHATEKLAKTGHHVLKKAGLTADDVDWVIPHQANLRIITSTAKKMNISMDRVIVTVQDHGNTSAASIPLAMSQAVQDGKLKKGDLVVTEAIGGGLAWGSVALRW